VSPAPAVNQPIREQLQKTLSGTHTLERELGGGGMSKVFVAEETRLRRKVVVKVLPPELAQGISVERFEREIQTVAALQQANIVPVINAGDTNGLPYYTMPFVEGESLRARLARGPLAVTEVIGVLRDVARALAYAHQRGVVHRDIKPDNVLMSGGAAVVTDFGIAKAITASRTDSGAGATLTQVGTSIGTPAYMAPEQAAGDPGIDHRADIYSLGAMAYELLAGQPVFAGRTPQRMLAAHMSEVPKPITEHRGDLPEALANLVMQCLAKESEQRPQQAGDIVRVLETITSGSGMQSAPPVLLGGAAMFRKALAIYAAAFVAVAVLAKAAIVGIGLPDWVFPGSLIVMALGLPVILWTGYVQRVARRAYTMTPTFTPGGSPSMAQGTIQTMALKAAPRMSWYKTARGGAYALGVFVALIAAFMIMRQFGIGPFGSLMASGAFGNRERVILAEFKGPASDTTLGSTVTEAFRTDVGQSENLVVVPALAVRSVLQRMQKPPSTRVDFDLAREVATRDGIKAVIDGDIVSLGGSYVLSVRLVSAQSGEQLAAFRETAADQKEIIPAISRVSKALRARIGESLRRVQSTKSLDKVSTASMEALQKYVAGSRADYEEGDFDKSVRLLEEAIALDSGFAMAYRRLGVILANRGIARERVSMLATKAYEHRDRLSDVERQNAIAIYYRSGPTPDRGKVITALEAILSIDSSDVAALNNLSQEYSFRREFAKAELLTRRAVVADPTVYAPQANLLLALAGQGKAKEVDEVLEGMSRNLPRHPGIVVSRRNTMFYRGEYDGATAVAESLRKARPNDEASQAAQAAGLASLAQVRGELTQAARFIAELRQRNAAAGNRQAMLNAALGEVEFDIHFRDSHATALQKLERALVEHPLDSIGVFNRPYDRVVAAFAEAGRPDLAQSTLKRAEASGYFAARDRSDAEQLRRTALGDIAMAEKRYDDAAREYRAGDIGQCTACALPRIARAFDRAGKADSAVAYYAAYLVSPSRVPGNDAMNLAGSHERLGQLYDAKGNAEKAGEHYRKFVELWKNADPELQPRVKAARERLAKLEPKR
jgi:tetratricopeptide (TPR) repeat protein